MSCAKPSLVKSPACPFLEPTVVEGQHKSLDEVMRDVDSTTEDLLMYAAQSEDALASANADKAACKELEK